MLWATFLLQRAYFIFVAVLEPWFIQLEMWANVVMAAPPNIGGAVCSTPQSLANAHY